MSAADSLRPETILLTARAVVRREAQALSALSEQLDQSFVMVVDAVLSTPGKVITTGAGTSGIMAERLAHLLSVSGTPAFYLPCLDALHGGMGSVSPTDLVIAFSKGGRSSELVQLVRRLVERQVFVVAVTEAPGSEFATAASLVAAIKTEPGEADLGSLIATGSTLVAGAWGDALAAVLMSMRDYSWSEVVSTHPGGTVGEQTELPSSHAVTVEHEAGPSARSAPVVLP